MSVVRGWCPSAHRPMMSGDGFLVRVRPPMARLTAAQVSALCDLAERFGSGLLDLTSRGNLQLRGVGAHDHAPLLAGLIEAGLAAATAQGELPLTVSPFLSEDRDAIALVDALMAHAPYLPELPGKIGIVIDTGRARRLSTVSGDFRFERGEDGLILRADGATLGRPVSLATAGQALVEMAEWFCKTGGATAGRMRLYIETAALPSAWTLARPHPQVLAPPEPDAERGILGVEFGQVTSRDLRTLTAVSGAASLAISPWRTLHVLGHGDRVTDVSLPVSESSRVSPGLSGEGAEISRWNADISRTTDISGGPPDITAGNPKTLAESSEISAHGPGVSAHSDQHAKRSRDISSHGPSRSVTSPPCETDPAAHMSDIAVFIADASDPRRRFEACPGAPYCSQASVATRPLARRMAGRMAERAQTVRSDAHGPHGQQPALADAPTAYAKRQAPEPAGQMPQPEAQTRNPQKPQPHRRIHISGCDKGCAYRGRAAITLVGQNGAFDLVLNGRAGDTPVRRGLTEAEALELLDDL